MKKTTFDEILSGAAEANRTRLMAKARQANRLAKVTRGRSRNGSYAVKHRALKSLIDKFRDETVITTDPKTPTMVVVSMKSSPFGLHIPRSIVAGA
jgi:hypothetical protein